MSYYQFQIDKGYDYILPEDYGRQHRDPNDEYDEHNIEKPDDWDEGQEFVNQLEE